MKDLKQIIEHGIKLEEEFIILYMKVIKDEGFVQYFDNNQEQATKLLEQLIEESTWHKEALEKILISNL